jgi:Cu2+-containing amine oxidase
LISCSFKNVRKIIYDYSLPEGRRPLGRSKRIWEDNIKMDLGEIGFGDVDWIHLAQDRDRWRALVNTVMNLWVP